MEGYKNFRIGTIVWAYYLKDASEEKMQKDIDFFKSKMPLNKAYLENHRGLVDVPVEKMKIAKSVFEKNGIKVSGCITSTGLVGSRKPSIFDTYCFSDEADRAEYVRIVEELASVVDEIILDDYFFCSCRCEKCIEGKKNKTWSQYRLDLMEDFSRVIVKRAKEINPNMNFIIKYPNWYESWQETGYNPEKQKDIFDMIYTGTETRDSVHSQQHMQRYLSYSQVRYMENVAPNRNGGGWIDPFDTDVTGWFEQANLTLLAKAKELMLFNFEEMTTNNLFPPLGPELRRTDARLNMLGNPCGVSVYEPYNGDGEDLLYTYLGMCGVSMEPTPVFKNDEPVIFCAQSACVDKDIMNKLKQYVKDGGTAVVTLGFLKEQYDNGIKDMTSIRLTGRHVMSSNYMINYRNHTDFSECSSNKDIMFEVLSYKTNATWADVSAMNGEYNFPVLSEDNYGKGRLFILNVPDNFADIYKLPKDVKASINKFLTIDREVYIASEDKCSLLSYDNGKYVIIPYADRKNSTPSVGGNIEPGENEKEIVNALKDNDKVTSLVRVFIRDESKGIRNTETGKVYDNLIALPKPSMWFDGCTIMPESDEYAVDIPMMAGEMNIIEIIR